MTDSEHGHEQEGSKDFAAKDPDAVMQDLVTGDSTSEKSPHYSSMKARTDKFLADMREDDKKWHAEQGIERSEPREEREERLSAERAAWNTTQDSQQADYEQRAREAHQRTLDEAQAQVPIGPTNLDRTMNIAHSRQLQEARGMRADARAQVAAENAHSADIPAAQFKAEKEEAQERPAKQRTRLARKFLEWGKSEKVQSRLQTFHDLIKPVGLGGAGTLIAELSMHEPGDQITVGLGAVMVLAGGAWAGWYGDRRYKDRQEAARENNGGN